MEAMRRKNPSICHKDFRARMPHHVQIRSNETEVKAIYSLSTVGMRQTRFRKSGCCLAWYDRAGGDTLQKYILDLLPQHCKDADSTEDFRDLTKSEISEMEEPNRGKYMEKAGTWAKSRTTKAVENNHEIGDASVPFSLTSEEDKLGTQQGQPEHKTQHLANRVTDGTRERKPARGDIGDKNKRRRSRGSAGLVAAREHGSSAILPQYTVHDSKLRGEYGFPSTLGISSYHNQDPYSSDDAREGTFASQMNARQAGSYSFYPLSPPQVLLSPSTNASYLPLGTTNNVFDLGLYESFLGGEDEPNRKSFSCPPIASQETGNEVATNAWWPLDRDAQSSEVSGSFWTFEGAPVWIPQEQFGQNPRIEDTDALNGNVSHMSGVLLRLPFLIGLFADPYRLPISAPEQINSC